MSPYVGDEGAQQFSASFLVGLTMPCETSAELNVNLAVVIDAVRTSAYGRYACRPEFLLLLLMFRGGSFVWSKINVIQTELVGWIMQCLVGLRRPRESRFMEVDTTAVTATTFGSRETTRCQQAAVDDMSYDAVMTAAPLSR
jgi:hypothetical protein